MANTPRRAPDIGDPPGVVIERRVQGPPRRRDDDRPPRELQAIAMFVVACVLAVIEGVAAVISLRENDVATLSDTMDSPLVTMIIGALIGFAVGTGKNSGPR